MLHRLGLRDVIHDLRVRFRKVVDTAGNGQRRACIQTSAVPQQTGYSRGSSSHRTGSLATAPANVQNNT